MAQEARSLWEQLDSEVEPWRRGRLVLVLIALIHFAFQGVLFAGAIAVGGAETLLTLIAVVVLFWMQFYLIWIGVHWIRWLAGASAGLLGFAYVIWGLRDDSFMEIAFGCIDLFIGASLGMSPSVYFFAKHQKERRNWLHSLAIAGVFIMLFLTLFLGMAGFSGYRLQLEAQASEFANEAFTQIFRNHDADFLLDHLTEGALAAGGGRDQMTKFLQYSAVQTGDVRDIKPAATELKLTYNFPAKFECIGRSAADAAGRKGSLRLQLFLVRTDQGWRIEDLKWHYPHPLSR